MTEVPKNEKSVIINLLVLDIIAACQRRRCQRQGFNPWVRKILRRRAWHPTPVLLPGECHGQRGQEGYSP